MGDQITNVEMGNGQVEISEGAMWRFVAGEVDVENREKEPPPRGEGDHDD